MDVFRDLDTAEALKIDAALRPQIDMLYSVGLPDEMLRFFQTLPIEIVRPTGTLEHEPGFYSGIEKNVQVSISLLTFGHKPVLIREMLYAYLDQKLQGGVNNPALVALYKQAKATNAFALGSHMMSNTGEFFASAGTTYLYGVTAQEPFSRDKISSNQPDLVVFLKSLFGPNAGTYVGSLKP